MALRSDRPALSRELVVTTALALVDRGGEKALTMRRLGQELGVEAMSLYHHVPSKEALRAGIVEALVREMRVSAADVEEDSWPELMLVLGRRFRTVLAAHPRAIPIMASHSITTPGGVEQMEVLYGKLVSRGMTATDANVAINIVAAYVLGYTMTAVSPADQATDADVTREAIERLAAEHFPIAHELMRHELDHDAVFDTGLSALVNGLPGALAAMPAPRPRTGQIESTDSAVDAGSALLAVVPATADPLGALVDQARRGMTTTVPSSSCRTCTATP